MIFRDCYRSRESDAIEAYLDFVFLQGRLNRAIVIIRLKHNLQASSEACVSEGDVAVCSLACNRNPREAA